MANRSGLVRVGAALAAASIALTACSGGSNAVDQSAAGSFHYRGATKLGTTIAVGQRKTAGPVTGQLLSGTGQYSLAADEGKVVVLNFWQTLCNPCTVESPQFDQVYRRMKSKGVNFVGLDVADVSKDAARSFISENKISYPTVYDENSKTALQLGKLPLAALPDTVIVDKHGRVAAVYIGPVAQGDLNPVLTALVQEP